MDDKYLEALYNQLSSTHDFGNLDSFKQQMNDPGFRKALYADAGNSLDLGSYDAFEGAIKKKSHDDSAFQNSSPASSDGTVTPTSTIPASSPASTSTSDTDPFKLAPLTLQTGTPNVLDKTPSFGDMVDHAFSKDPAWVAQKQKHDQLNTIITKMTTDPNADPGDLQTLQQLAQRTAPPVPKDEPLTFDKGLQTFKDGFNSTWMPFITSLSEGINTVATKPIAGAIDMIGRAYTGITGNAAPGWLGKDSWFSHASDATEKEYNNVNDKNNVAQGIVSGIGQALPLAASMFTGEGEMNMANQGFNAMSGLVKTLAATHAFNSYKDATDQGLDATQSNEAFLGGGAEGAVEGWTMEAQMMLGGALGSGVSNKLAEYGLLKGNFTQKLLNSLAVGTVFGGTDVLGKVASGEPVDWDSAAKSFGTGMAFELPGVVEGAGKDYHDYITNKDLNDKTAGAAYAAMTVKQLNDQSVIRNLAGFTPDQILDINKTAPSADDLYALSIKKGMDAYDADTPEEKTELYQQQLSLKNQADVKYATQRIIANKDGFLESFANSDLPEDAKTNLLGKVTFINKNFNPVELEKTDIGQSINTLNDNIQQTQTAIANTDDPAEKSNHYVAMNDLVGQRVQAQNRLFEINVEQQKADAEKQSQLNDLQAQRQQAQDSVKPAESPLDGNAFSATAGDQTFTGATEDQVRAQVNDHFDQRVNDINKPEPTEAATAAEATPGQEAPAPAEKINEDALIAKIQEVPMPTFEGLKAPEKISLENIKATLDGYDAGNRRNMTNEDRVKLGDYYDKVKAVIEKETTVPAGEAATVDQADVKTHPIDNDIIGKGEIMDYKPDGSITLKLDDGSTHEVPMADRALLGIHTKDVDSFKAQNGLAEAAPAGEAKEPSLYDRIQNLAEKIHSKDENFTDAEVKLHTLYPEKVQEATDLLARTEPVNDPASLNIWNEQERAEAKDWYKYKLDMERGRLGLDNAKSEETGIKRQIARNETKSAPGDFMKKVTSPFTPQSLTEARAKLLEMQRRYREMKKDLRDQFVDKERGANFLIEKLSRAARQNDIPQQGADLAIDLIRMNPELYKDLAISITQPQRGSDTWGFYDVAQAMIKVFKNSGESTATHELLHHSERFLPDEARNNILKEWHEQSQKQRNRLIREMKGEKDPERLEKLGKAVRYLELAEQRQIETDPTKRNEIYKTMRGYLRDGVPSSYYRFLDPSEWWAENATVLFREHQENAKKNSWLDKVVQWYNGLNNALANVFGLNDVKNVERGLKAVMSGDTLDEATGSMLNGARKLYQLDDLPRPERAPGESLRDYTQRVRDFLDKQKERDGMLPPAEPPVTTPTEEYKAPDWDLDPETRTEKFTRKWQDYLNRAKKVQDSIEQAGGKISERTDFYTSADLQGSRAADLQRQLYERMVKSPDKKNPAFFERLLKDDLTKKELDDYLRASHVEEYNREVGQRRRQAYETELQRLEDRRQDAIKNKNPSSEGYYERQIKAMEDQKVAKYPLMDDGAAGMTNAQAQGILDDFRAEGKIDKLKQYGDEFVKEVSNRQLEAQLESGTIDKDTHDLLKKRYENYVPFQVEDFLHPKDGKNLKRNSSTNVNRVDNIIRRAKGSVERTADQRVSPSTYGVIQLEKSYIEGEKNKTLNRLYNLVEQNPNDTVFEIVPPKYAPVYRRDGSVSGFKEVTDPNTVKNAIQLYRDGRKMYIDIKDPTLRRAVKKEGIVKTIGILDNVNNYLRTVNTLKSPEFWVTNAVKDFQTAGFNLSTEETKGLTAKMAKGVFPAMKAVFQYEHGHREGEWAPVFERYLAAGGKTSVVRPATDIEKIQSIDKVVDDIGKKKGVIQNTKAMMHWVATFGDASELGTRLSVFKAGTDAGMSDEQAATLSRNATINFNKKGEFSGIAGNFYLMFNGGMQGKLYLAKRLISSPLARKIYGGMFVGGFLSAALNNQASNPNDPVNDYNSLSEYEKQNNFIFKNFAGDGFIKIPAGHGLNVPYYMGAKMYEVLNGKTTPGKSAMDVLQVAMNAYSPVANATIAQTIVPSEPLRIGTQYLENKNAFGSPVYKEADKFGLTQPSSHTHFGSTDPNMVKLAQGLNHLTGGTGVKSGMIDLSPDVMEWMVSTAGGGLGRTVLEAPHATAEVTEHVAQKLGMMPASVQLTPMDMSKIPFLHKFYSEGKPANYKSVIFSTLEKSGNTELSGAETNDFFNAAGNAFGHGQITSQQYKQYTKEFETNQIRIQMGNAAPDLERKAIDAIDKKPHMIR